MGPLSLASTVRTSSPASRLLQGVVHQSGKDQAAAAVTLLLCVAFWLLRPTIKRLRASLMFSWAVWLWVPEPVPEPLPVLLLPLALAKSWSRNVVALKLELLVLLVLVVSLVEPVELVLEVPCKALVNSAWLMLPSPLVSSSLIRSVADIACGGGGGGWIPDRAEASSLLMMLPLLSVSSALNSEELSAVLPALVSPAASSLLLMEPSPLVSRDWSSSSANWVSGLPPP